MTATKRTRLRAMLDCIAYGLAIAVVYNLGFVFLAGMFFSVWLLSYSMFFKNWNER